MVYSYFKMKRRIKIRRHGFVGCMHNSPKFSYRETRRKKFSTAMRLAAPRRQANKVLIDKRSSKFLARDNDFPAF